MFIHTYINICVRASAKYTRLNRNSNYALNK